MNEETDLKMSVETHHEDIVAVVETMDISKEDSLKIVQSVCKKLAMEGEEMMFMTVNLSQKTTTCIGSQLGINFLNYTPSNALEGKIPNISEMFQHFLEDHYEISNVCNNNDRPFSPAGSVIMHSPVYTPFSSPRPYRAKRITDSDGNSGKLLTPKIETIDSDYDGHTTATDSQCDEPPEGATVYPTASPTFLIAARSAENGVMTNTYTQVNQMTPSQARPVLARLLSGMNRNQSGFSRFSSPTNRNASSFPRYQSPSNQNMENLGRMVTAVNDRPHSVSSFQAPVGSNNLTSSTNSSTPLFPSTSHKRGRPKRNMSQVDSSYEDETDDTENETTQKMVTLRSGRKVKVPSWRKSILEDVLRNNLKKQEVVCDIPIKQERISPTFQDEEESVHVEFDFDLLAELKKESETDQEQSDASWCGTVHLTSGEDSTPNKVPFKFNFKDKELNSDTSSSVSINTNSIGLVKKPPINPDHDTNMVVPINKPPINPDLDNTVEHARKPSINPDLTNNVVGPARKPPINPDLNTSTNLSSIPCLGRNTIDNKFNYYSMFSITKTTGDREYKCRICFDILSSQESLKVHCFSHEEFLHKHPVCRTCDSVFTNIDELHIHVLTHESTCIHCCHVCYEKFESKLSLLQHLNWVHKELFSCPKCDLSFTTSKILSRHMESCFDAQAIMSRAGMKLLTDEWISVKDNGMISFRCRSCKDCFDTVVEYNQHMLKHRSKFVLDVNKKMEKIMLTTGSEKPTKRQPIQKAKLCDICNNKFESAWYLAKHKRLYHGTTDTGSTPVAFKCSSCDIHFDEEVDFSKHCMNFHSTSPEFKSSDEGNYVCDKCSKKMKSKEGFELHKKIHENLERKTCEKCGTDMPTEASMELHSCVQTFSDFKCDECGLYFISKSLLSGHQCHVHGRPMEDLQNQDGGSNACNVCGKVFKKASDLQIHKSVHTGELPHVCHLCQKKFRLRSTLKSHLMTHRDYHEFICEVCGRTFKLMESLRLHRRLHSSSCYFKCKHCPKEFRAYDGLKYHMLREHRDKVAGNNLKIYKCEYCDKDMATHQQYVRHVSIHTNDKPLKCDLCETRWATISQLNAHKKKHDAGHLKYGCDVCQKKFPILSKLNRHIKTAKHIENCTLKNLPVDTVHLHQTGSVEGFSVEQSEKPDEKDEKVEIMFYEINLQGEQSEENSSSMIYDITPDQNAIFEETNENNNILQP